MTDWDETFERIIEEHPVFKEDWDEVWLRQRLDKMTLIDEILEMDDETLARVWVAFNKWEWPQDLSTEYKPYWWDEQDGLTKKDIADRKFGLSGPFLDYIEAHVDGELIHEEWGKDQGIYD